MSYRYQPSPFISASPLLFENVNQDAVESPSQDWVDMAARWELPLDLLGGTLRMRAAAQRWLPMEPKETWQGYNIRLSRAVLHDGLSNAINRILSKPFSREVVTKGEVAPQIEAMFNDVDLKGANITQFARQCMRDALIHGKTHFLVEYPKTGGSQTLAAERDGRIRPYFLHTPASTVIAWRSAIDPTTGEEYPVHIRVRDEIQRPLGAYGTERVHRVRVYEPGLYREYQRAVAEREYTLVDETTVLIDGRPMTRIPFVTVYFEHDGFFLSKPPLEPLAWTNLAHWQSSADQRNALRFARIGILLARGFTNEETEKGFTIAPNMAVVTTNPNADLKYVEHTGAAIQAGERDLDHLERLMEIQGVSPLVERSADGTATGKSIDEKTNNSQAQMWVRSLELGLVEGFSWAHAFTKEQMPEDFAIDIFNDFALSVHSDNDISKLIEMRNPMSPQISHATFINEVKRRGTLSDDVDAEKEYEAIQSENLSSLPLPDPGDLPPEPSGSPNDDPDLGATGGSGAGPET